MNKNVNSINDSNSPELNPIKIDKLKNYLNLKKKKEPFIFINVINMEVKIIHGRSFYCIDLRVAKKRMDFLTRLFNPFVIRESKSFRLNNKLGVCIRCKSATDFRMVFDNNPGLELQKEYKLENNPPIPVIERQIAFPDELKYSNSLLKQIIYGIYIKLPSLNLDLSIDTNHVSRIGAGDYKTSEDILPIIPQVFKQEYTYSIYLMLGVELWSG